MMLSVVLFSLKTFQQQHLINISSLTRTSVSINFLIPCFPVVSYHSLYIQLSKAYNLVDSGYTVVMLSIKNRVHRHPTCHISNLFYLERFFRLYGTFNTLVYTVVIAQLSALRTTFRDTQQAIYTKLVHFRLVFCFAGCTVLFFTSKIEGATLPPKKFIFTKLLLYIGKTGYTVLILYIKRAHLNEHISSQSFTNQTR